MTSYNGFLSGLGYPVVKFCLHDFSMFYGAQLQWIRFFAYIFCQKCKTQLLTHTMHNRKSHLAMK